jgi:hypothetical protein
MALRLRTVQTLWLKHSDPETRDKQAGQAVVGIIENPRRDEAVETLGTSKMLWNVFVQEAETGAPAPASRGVKQLATATQRRKKSDFAATSGLKPSLARSF